MRRCIVVFLLLAASFAFGQSNDAWDGSGTGFIIDPNGIILTAAHVVNGAQNILVSSGGKSWEASILSIDNQHDIALLSIEASGLAFLPLANSNTVLLGEDIRVAGFPLSTVIGTSLKISRGTISGIDPIRTQKIFQIDAAVNPGNSGGPLINDKGQVVGIVNSKLSAALTEGIAFAVPINYARPMLSQDLVDFKNGDPTSSKLEGTQLAKISQSSVVYILVRNTKYDPSPPAQESISVKKLDLVDNVGTIRGRLALTEKNSPYLALYGDDFAASASLGLNNEGQPYLELGNSNSTRISVAFSQVGNPGIWLWNKDNDVLARFYLTDAGARIDMLDPEDGSYRLQVVSDTKSGNQILFWGKKYLKMKILDSVDATYIKTWSEDGTYLWSSDY